MSDPFVNDRCLVVVHRGREVGAVRATYDLSGLAPEFHPFAKSVCDMTTRLVTNLPSGTQELAEYQAATHAALEAWKARPWWRRLLGLGPKPGTVDTAAGEA